MDSQERLVENLVMKVKQEITFSQNGMCSLVAPSPYDTAWLAMVPNPQKSDEPLFKGCLDWLLSNQNGEGFWGQADAPRSLDSLTSTLACVVALATWNVGHVSIQKGLAFIHANTENILKEQAGSLPQWFVILFPAMVELKETKGLGVHFSNGSTALVEQVVLERQEILERQRLQSSDEDGLIQSPSAIAYAFMKTGQKELLSNLNSVVQNCGFGVPAVYPLDDDLLQVCLVDRIERLGLAEHFMEEITSMLGQVYRSYMREEPNSVAKNVMPQKLYRDALAFRLLRLHGYSVSPRKLCRFFLDHDVVVHIEENQEMFRSAIYNVYRATDVTFPEESELENLREFSRTILEKDTTKHNNNLVEPNSMTNLQDQVRHEISIPWLARLDHLEHRRCIETKETLGPWTGQALSYRLSCESTAMLLQLAIENYTLRQSIFRNELMELQRWAKDMGLCDMGFAREKTTYCYFAVASTLVNSSLSAVRVALVKTAVLVTVADDFFDKEGSMNELELLADAVKGWQQKGLNGHGKTIFKALTDLVDDISWQFFVKFGYDIKTHIQDLWHQTFLIWLKEAEWIRNEQDPPIAEYLKVATSSIASQTILLPAALLLGPPPNTDILKCPQSHPLTSLLMLLTRLLNDIRSYEREKEEGKPNLVLLHMKENPGFRVEESIDVIQKLLDEKKKEFMKQVLVKDTSTDGMSEAWKQLHLSGLKVFQMFFNSTNAFDSPTELLADIKKAIYDPLASSESTSGLKKEKSLASYAKIDGKSHQQRIEISGSYCAIKVQGNLRKVFVVKPFSREISLKLGKPTIYARFPKPVAFSHLSV